MADYKPVTLFDLNTFKIVGVFQDGKLVPESMGLVPKTQIMNAAYQEIVSQTDRWSSKVAGRSAELPYITMGTLFTPFIYNQAIYNIRVIGRYVTESLGKSFSGQNTLLYRISTKPLTEAWYLLAYNTADLLDELRHIGDLFKLPDAAEIDTVNSSKLPATSDVLAAGLNALQKKQAGFPNWPLFAILGIVGIISFADTRR